MLSRRARCTAMARRSRCRARAVSGDDYGMLAVAATARPSGAVFVFVCLRQEVRAGQLIVLADGKADLVDFAVSLQARIDDLHKAVDEIASALTRVDKRFDGAVSNVALVRYDAYGDRGGQQSATVAMLDSCSQRRRGERDPGPRLRAHLHERARSGQLRDHALAGRGRGCPASDGALSPKDNASRRRARLDGRVLRSDSSSTSGSSLIPSIEPLGRAERQGGCYISSQGATGSGAELQLRASERVHRAASACAGLQGPGGGDREVCAAASLGQRHLPSSARHPACSPTCACRGW